MSVDITFHYPPELFNLLVDTVSLINRSKKGCGAVSAPIEF